MAASATTAAATLQHEEAPAGAARTVRDAAAAAAAAAAADGGCRADSDGDEVRADARDRTERISPPLPDDSAMAFACRVAAARTRQPRIALLVRLMLMR